MYIFTAIEVTTIIEVLLHLHRLHIMAAMEKAMKAAKKATRKECLTISTGSSRIALGPCSIA
jgi:hypothetical protein